MNIAFSGDGGRCDGLAVDLGRRGHALQTVDAPGLALELARTRRIDALLVEDDDLLDAARGVVPDVPVIVIGHDDTARAAARARARGAFGYVASARGAALDAEAREALCALVDRLAARARLEAERAQRLEEGQRSRRFYEDVLTNVGQGIVVIDQGGRIRFHNPEAARILGEDDEGALAAQAAVPLLQMLVDTLVEGRPKTRMIAQQVDDEQKVFLDVTTSVLRGADGRPAGAIAIVSDRSTEKRLEEQLIHTERLATLGSLLASIAHEITNTLTSITGCAEMGLEVASDAEQAAGEAREPATRTALEGLAADIRQIFDTVLEAGINTQTIANNMLQYSRQSSPARVVRQDVNELIRKTLKTLGKHLGTDKVTVELDLDASAPCARLEPSKLQQALVNLVVNAIHALQEVPPPRRVLRIVTRADAAARLIHLHVIDQGPGISPRKMEKIFQPFFTTKGHGTGLGLYISRKVLQDQGGTITLQSEVGKGTQFTIQLPME
ncbi:MAG: PAS domain S-box protein [Planctomycetes bacterium]|nr:PAS domain S-box protein [Planctomycetota bacterium]